MKRGIAAGTLVVALAAGGWAVHAFAAPGREASARAIPAETRPIVAPDAPLGALPDVGPPALAPEGGPPRFAIEVTAGALSPKQLTERDRAVRGVARHRLDDVVGVSLVRATESHGPLITRGHVMWVVQITGNLEPSDAPITAEARGAPMRPVDALAWVLRGDQHAFEVESIPADVTSA